MAGERINLGIYSLGNRKLPFRSRVRYHLFDLKAFSAIVIIIGIVITVALLLLNPENSTSMSFTTTLIVGVISGIISAGVISFASYITKATDLKFKYVPELEEALLKFTDLNFNKAEVGELLRAKGFASNLLFIFNRIKNREFSDLLEIISFGQIEKYFNHTVLNVKLYWDNKTGFFVIIKKSDIIVMTNNDFTPQNNAQDNPQDQPLNFNKEPQQTTPEQNPHYSSPYTNQSSQREPYYGQPAPQQPQPQYQAPQPLQPQYQAPQQAPYGYGAPAPQQPYYNQAPQQNPYQQVAPRKNNSFAVTAFVLGLAQILLWWAWVPAPLAVVFGHIALSQIKKTNEDGRVFALIGLILGYVGIFLGAVFLFFIFWASAFDGSSGYNDYSDYDYSSSELM